MVAPVESPDESARAEPSSAATETRDVARISAKEAADVRKMQAGVARAIRLKQAPDAVYLSNHCIELYPNNADCRLLLQQVDENLFGSIAKKEDRALEIKVSALLTNGTASDIANSITEIMQHVYTLTKQDNLDKALEIAQGCMTKAPTIPECQLMLGVLYYKRKDVQKGAQAYQRFLAMTPEGHPRRERVIQFLRSNRSEADGASRPPP